MNFIVLSHRSFMSTNGYMFAEEKHGGSEPGRGESERAREREREIERERERGKEKEANMEKLCIGGTN
jgi:hypothetical protein